MFITRQALVSPNIMLLTQTVALLAIFGAEIDRAGVTPWTPQLRAQITVESAWRPDVCSRFACGLAQFTPATWGDIAPLTRPSCADQQETDPACSIRAQIVYMQRLLRRYTDSERRDQWAFAWAAYNGGAGWISREKRQCRKRPGCDPARWYANVADQCIRAAWACRENRAYPRKIERAMG